MPLIGQLQRDIWKLQTPAQEARYVTLQLVYPARHSALHCSILLQGHCHSEEIRKDCVLDKGNPVCHTVQLLIASMTIPYYVERETKHADLRPGDHAGSSRAQGRQAWCRCSQCYQRCKVSWWRHLHSSGRRGRASNCTACVYSPWRRKGDCFDIETQVQFTVIVQS
jgi:hypothetical protein